MPGSDTYRNGGERCRVNIVAIAASAGGIGALESVLFKLPKDFPCVIVVQHILQGFASMLCDNIDRRCQMHVSVAKGGERLARGHVYFAGDGRQLEVGRVGGGLSLRYGTSDKISGHCPSADALFASVAECAAEESLGVILTGMGTDGANGLLKMREAGAYTIGQDAESSAVYGMPRAAFQNGAVTRQLPLAAIPNEIIRYVNSR